MTDTFVTIVFPIILLFVGAALGIGGTITWELIRERYKFKKELQDNASIDVSGNDWYAAWQTSVDNSELLNTEQVSMVQRGKTVQIRNLERAPENPKGGYFWEGQLQFSQARHLLGWYFPVVTENNSSNGTIFLFYNGARKEFYGKWVGATYDGDLATGFTVITKDRERSRELLRKLLASHHESVNIFATFEHVRTEVVLGEVVPQPKMLESKETLDAIPRKREHKHIGTSSHRRKPKDES